jgi:hypothetical protein
MKNSSNNNNDNKNAKEREAYKVSENERFR